MSGGESVREIDYEPGEIFLKHDKGKLRFDLICLEMEEALASVFTCGAQKYGDRNCEKSCAYSRFYAAARRHGNAFWKGEDKDPESGMEHAAHAAWNWLMLLTQMRRGVGRDDRSL